MSNNKKTLIILSPGFPKNENDSTCLPFLQTFVRSIKQVNPSLQVIVIAFEYPFFAKEYAWENISVISFNGRNRGRLYKLFLWTRIWKRIKRLVRKNEVIGFFSLWLGECALMGKHASRKTGLKNFTWILGQDAREDNKYLKHIKPNGKNLVAMSDFLADNFQKNFRIRPEHIIPLGVDKSLFPQLPPERAIDIMGAGSLIPLKQYDIFIKVIASLVKQRPNLRAVIAGEGKERESLQRMINANKLSNNITLAGETSHAATLAMMQQSKIFLHPSSYEGFGTVCAEALYAGAKLVSFVKPMRQEFKNWFIVKTEEEMVFQIEMLLDDTNVTYDRVMLYDSEDIAKQILTLFRSA